MPALTVYQVDSFTAEPFRGNPAGVCVTAEPLDDALMQSIAAEMNLSETAFAVPRTDGPLEQVDLFSLRWFTPEVEVELCGHATLATAKILYDTLRLSTASVTFETLSGELRVTRQGDAFRMDFPADATEACALPEGLANALGATSIGDTRISMRMRMLMLRLEDPDELRALTPDFRAVAAIERTLNAHGVIVTSSGGRDADFISRYFAPACGIPEDPVTGSAHCVLAPYWGEHLGVAEMRAFQASRRGGWLDLRLHGDRVHIIGQAVTVLEARLRIP